ncbi:MAG: hypothetical protein M1816_001189 [Peltula sp. TS41687]|nr:MAG: hypothetical protein M1816_001189 [Peltula sp. TS41687]
MALDLLRYNGSMPSYSFQQAMNPDPVHVDPYLRNFKFYGDPHFRLYDNGCGPDHNCTQSCQDPSVVFSSMYALHNCIMYPLVSSIVLAGNFSQSGLEVANHFGMTGHANITSEIKRVVNSCIDEYCSTKSGTEDPCSTSYDIPIGYSNACKWDLVKWNGTVAG